MRLGANLLTIKKTWYLLLLISMAVRCKKCLLKFTSKLLLERHHMKLHSNKVRCTLCYLRFPTLKILHLHYLRKHSKQQISKQLINHSSSCIRRPFKWIKTKKTAVREKRGPSSEKTEKLYIKDNIHITYGNKEIIMELNSDNEESLELSIEDVPVKSSSKQSWKCDNKNKPSMNALIYDDNANCTFEEIKSDEKLVILPAKTRQNKSKKKAAKGRRQPKTYKYFCLEFVKPDDPKSLDHETGQFYICKCCLKHEDSLVQNKDEVITVTSDTESSSDNGKYCFYPIVDKKLYCTICGNGYRTKNKLLEHRKSHNYYCQTCSTYFCTYRQYTEHVKNHILVYCCHICKHVFIQKLLLLNHLNCHQEQEILENVLELEHTYSHYLINFSSDTYATSINNITTFLGQSCDFKYSQNPLNKIRCHLCFLDIFKYDFDQHMKMHCYLKKSTYLKRSIEYSHI